MRIIGWILALVGLVAVAPALAEVKHVSEGGFEVASTAVVTAPPSAVYATLIMPSRWWSAAHSYSGDARNMAIDARAGGCFCEVLPPDGAVEHGRVIFAQPGKMLRIDGALGPLQAMATVGRLTFMLEPEGTGTKVTMTYVVGGYISGGASQFAAPVDQVLGEQLAGLKAAIDAQRQ